MPKTIISDTSCFIILTKIGELELLHRVYGQVVTTPDIAVEYGEKLPEWVDVVPVKDKTRQQLLEMQIDKGESSAIALAFETPDCILILDDYKAHKIAERLGLSLTGTIGVIIKAKLRGVIPSVKPLLDKIKQTNFRLSPELESLALRAADEFE
jgi:predicted nucleic acid-binding protein